MLKRWHWKQRFNPWVRKTPRTPTTKSQRFAWCIVWPNQMHALVFFHTSFYLEWWWMTGLVSKSAETSPCHYYEPEERWSKSVKNLTGIVFTNNDHNRSVNPRMKKGKKKRISQKPPLESQGNQTSRHKGYYWSLKYLRTIDFKGAENPKQILKKKINQIGER